MINKNIIPISIIILFVLMFVIGTFIKKKHLRDNAVYSVAKIVDVRANAKVSPSFEYYFYYNGEKIYSDCLVNNDYSGRSMEFLRNTFIGKNVIVKFSSKNTIYNELLLDISISDSIVNCDKCIWDKIPR